MQRFKNIKGWFGGAGFLIGGIVGFLLRPSMFLVGQLPFEHVISRGATLKGMDSLFVPLAEQSFNVTLVGAIIGAIAGIVIGYFVEREIKRSNCESNKQA